MRHSQGLGVSLRVYLEKHTKKGTSDERMNRLKERRALAPPGKCGKRAEQSET